MPLLRDKAPQPLPRTRRPAYPRVLEIGALLLLSACSRSNNDTPQEVPPPRPSGSAPALMVDADAPPPLPAPMGTVAAPIVEAGAPEAGVADAGKDAGKKVTNGAGSRPPRTAGVPAQPFDEKDLY